MPRGRKKKEEVVAQDQEFITDILEEEVVVEGEVKIKKTFMAGDKKIKEEVVSQ